MAYFSEDGKFLMDAKDKDKWLDALEVAKKFCTAGVCAWPSGGSVTRAKGLVSFKHPAWDPFFLKREAPKLTGKFGLIKTPRDAGVNDSGSFHAVTRISKQKEMAYKFVEFVLCNSERQNAMYKAYQQFPAYMPAWNDPIYKESDSYYSGQKIMKRFYEIAKTIPSVPITKHDWDAGDLTNIQLNLVFTKGKDIALALKDSLQK